VAYIPDKGWYWYIPLPDDVASVGVVAEPSYLYRGTRDASEILAREIDASVWIRDRVTGSRQIEPVRVTGEFSYYSQKIGGDGFCLVGDAYAFLDPLFSSGVFLALKGGEMAADAIHAGLQTGDVSARHFEDYQREQRHAVASFRSLVRAFYDLTFSFREFLDQYPHLHGAIVDTLVGNVFNDLTPLYEALNTFALRETRAEISPTSA
jgi:flavin-dependent dehydrogenase